MLIHTISAYETSAEDFFFGRLADWRVDMLLDTRLKNTNQLSVSLNAMTWRFLLTKWRMRSMRTTSCSLRLPLCSSATSTAT